jgi:RecA-family ATPase
LTGTVTSPTRELVPRLLYEGEPTLIYADGDTGKSLVALAPAVVVHSGRALPFGLTPARAVPAAYLDWETSRDTLEARLALIAAGLGIDPPAVLYKRMTRPLFDETAVLAAEFARRGIGFVVIDSKMFAVAGGEGAAFHEPITAFYNALRLFAPAASLVLNHVTNADARLGGPARPFGGAFAFNGRA